MTQQKKILVTGATGNIGKVVIDELIDRNTKRELKIVAAVRNVEKAKNRFREWEDKIEFQYFDFENKTSFKDTAKETNCVFLLRPPQISDIKIFKPVIKAFKENGIKEIIFLSVQGAEKSSIIPHNKIENEIKKSGIDFIFIRPSYFMQNLTTELLYDVKNKSKIILPAGRAKFNWIDIKNIGEVVSKLIFQFDKYKNTAIELTGDENKDFKDVSLLLSNLIGRNIQYENINPLKFYLMKRKEGIPIGKIVVMIVLHFLPRFQKEPQISNNYRMILGKNPTKLVDFIKREKQKF